MLTDRRSLTEIADQIVRVQESMAYDGCQDCHGEVSVEYDDFSGCVIATCRRDGCGWSERQRP